MKVNIIIPVYNAAKYIKECFLSVVNQTYENIEIIFVDDCGPDNSIAIIEQLKNEYPKKNISIIKNKQNIGTGGSRNNGITYSTGEYIYFMDADDTIVKNCIEILVSNAVRFNKPDIVCSNVNCPGYHYHEIQNTQYLNQKSEIRKSYFSNQWYEMPWNKLLKREFIIQNNLYFENIYFEDTLWSLQTAITAQSLLLLPEYTYNYRTSDTQKTARKDDNKRISDTIILYKSMNETCRRQTDRQIYNDSIIYITQLTIGLLSSIIGDNFYKKQHKAYKFDIYKKLRKMTEVNAIFQLIKTKEVPNGIKILSLHKLLPAFIGYYYSVILRKIF